MGRRSACAAAAALVVVLLALFAPAQAGRQLQPQLQGPGRRLLQSVLLPKRCQRGNPGYAQELIADPKETCALGTVNNMRPLDVINQNGLNYNNYLDTTINIKNMQKDSFYCDACFLYAQRVQNFPYNKNDQKSANSHFVITAPDGNNDHMLVIPTEPCRGVEDVFNAKQGTQCFGEEGWDTGLATLIGNTDSLQWGMTINPSNLRGKHQMHIHLAPAFNPPSNTQFLNNFIDVLKKMDPKASSGGLWYPLTCPTTKGTSRTVGLCTAVGTPAVPAAQGAIWAKPLEVQAVPGTTAFNTVVADELKVFERVYKAGVTPFTNAQQDWAAGLFRLYKQQFAIVAMKGRPAECLQDTEEGHGDPTKWKNGGNVFGKCGAFK